MTMDWNNVVSSDEEDVEDRGQEHHVRVRREQDMFHQEQCEVLESGEKNSHVLLKNNKLKIF